MIRLILLCMALVCNNFLCSAEVCDPNARVIFIRHGQADHNVNHTYNSNPSSKNYKISNLTPAGIEQVKQAAKELSEKKLNIVAVYISPMPRTRQTADLLAKEGLFNQNKIIVDPRLTERQFGDLEGKANVENSLFADQSFQKNNHIELDKDYRDRLNAFYEALVKSNPCGDVLVITHSYNIMGIVSIMSNREIPEPSNAQVVEEPLYPVLVH